MDITKAKLLIVDDHNTIRAILKQMLRQMGIKNYDEAETANAAYSQLCKNEYDIILLDWVMPTMSGIDLLKKIREERRFQSVGVIMVTSESAKENVIEAIKAGANDYVVKPFNANTLKDKLTRVYGKIHKS